MIKSSLKFYEDQVKSLGEYSSTFIMRGYVYTDLNKLKQFHIGDTLPESIITLEDYNFKN